MKKINIVAGLLLLSFIAIPTTSMAVPISLSDLWDVSNGTIVGANSGVLNYRPTYRSDIHDMFGDNNAVIEATNTLFKDYMSPGYVGGTVLPGFIHYVEWSTPSAVTLRSFALHAQNEGMDRRAFDRFQLYTGDGMGAWTSIYDTGAGFTYSGLLDLSIDVTPVVSQYFKAEFVQAPWSSSTAIGPRIQELDGFDTFLDGSTSVVPEPTTLALIGLGLAGLGYRRRKTS